MPTFLTRHCHHFHHLDHLLSRRTLANDLWYPGDVDTFLRSEDPLETRECVSLCAFQPQLEVCLERQATYNLQCLFPHINTGFLLCSKSTEESCWVMQLSTMSWVGMLKNWPKSKLPLFRPSTTRATQCAHCWDGPSCTRVVSWVLLTPVVTPHLVSLCGNW